MEESLLQTLPSKEQIQALPVFQNLPMQQIHLIHNIEQCLALEQELKSCALLGFDTESKPTFAKGDDRSNQYGPRRNTKGWEKVLAWIYILIFPLAFLAAIALPAYQDYVTRAQQAQMKQSIDHMD